MGRDYTLFAFMVYFSPNFCGFYKYWGSEKNGRISGGGVSWWKYFMKASWILI